MSDPANGSVGRVVVIGGGIGGLASAYRILESATAKGVSAEITVLEGNSRFGGVIESSERDGFVLEHGPDSILTTKPAGVRLLTDLGLDEDIQGTNADLQGGLIASGDRLLPIPDGLYLLAPTKLMPFVLSPLVSWPGKLRMALELLLPRRNSNLPEESLAKFVRRRMGAEALHKIAQPLVSGIYSADPEKLSLEHCMPQFAQMEREHGSIIRGMRKNMKAAGVRSGVTSGARYGMFVSLKGGLSRLVDRLVERLATCDLRASCAVEALERAVDGYRIVLADGSRLEADAVVVALPAHAAAKLCAGLDADLSDELEAVPYSGIATVNLAFRRQDVGALPKAAGFVVPSVEGRNIPACTFASIKYLGRAPDDGVLLRAFVGGALHEGDLRGDDTALVEIVLKDLKRWFPNLQAPLWSEVRRWPAAMAQPHVGHRERLARIRETESQVSGLALVGNGYEGVGIADIAAQAERAAEKVMTDRMSGPAVEAPVEKSGDGPSSKRPPKC
jgi:oxygen-dependent protoporphyrinogen oxidase